MPACFQLIDKTTHQPAILNEVDNRMRVHFNAAPDMEYWYCNWYNCIGFMLATGSSLDKIREVYSDIPDLLSVLNWIEANFETTCFYQHK